MPKNTPLTKIREVDYLRLKAYADKHGVPMTEILSRALKKLEVKKLETTEKTIKQVEMDICDECKEEVPNDSEFCPYCGVEFEPEEDEEDGEDEDE